LIQDSAYVVPNGYQGLVGRVTYDYDKRYLVEFNVGYNGTENFSPGRRFGYFPAYSLGWVASEESFFPENIRFLHILKSEDHMVKWVMIKSAGTGFFIIHPLIYIVDL
jgi:hypothetical protein